MSSPAWRRDGGAAACRAGSEEGRAASAEQVPRLLAISGECRPSSSALFRLQRVSLAYGNKPVLEDISLSVAEGAITALIGPSGSGKTSLLACLNRLTDLIPSCRVEGRISFRDQDLHAPDTDVLALRRRVGMIFQRPNPFPLSIRKNIELPLRDQGLRGRDRIHSRLQRALCDVGLWDEVKDRLDSPATSLSGGQQQRLCIARAMALEPEVLLLDEPCSALDPLSSARVENLVGGLRQRVSVVIVTHNLAQARRLADRVALLWAANGAGRLIEVGPTEQIFRHPRHELTAAYVGASGVRG
jgi:phosphate transport system ATP-binding protein